MLATIPYWTLPLIELGPLTLRTFGMMVAIGVLCGIWYAAAHAEQYGMSRDDTYALGVRMVIAGVIGSRVTWVLTHLDQIETPIDVIAVWEGGLQFSGGFIAAIAVGLPTFLRWTRLQRWQLLDGFAVAVLIGGAFGRLGCLAVGEHFGGESSAPWATTFKGAIGPVPVGEELREPTLGVDGPVVEVGTSFLNPSLYECVSLFLLFGILAWMLRRRPAPTPGLVSGIFLIAYGIQRFTWDSLRVNDERVAGLTGAQWMCLAMVPIGIYVLTIVRPACARLLAEQQAEEAAAGEPADGADPDGADLDADAADGADLDEEPADGEPADGRDRDADAADALPAVDVTDAGAAGPSGAGAAARGGSDSTDGADGDGDRAVPTDASSGDAASTS